MSVIENILYGLVSGLTEFLPVSGRGHQTLLYHLFGVNARLSLQDLLVHIGILFAVFVSYRDNITRLRWEQSMTTAVRRNKSRRIDTQSHYELRLLKAAVIPMLISTVFIHLVFKSDTSLISLMWFLLINGIVMLIAEHTRQGDRDAKTLTGFDSIIIGIATAASAIPGLSGVGMSLSYTTARGTDIQKATNWVILLVIPAMFFAILADIFYILIGGIGAVSFVMIIGCVLAGIGAFCGGYIGISILRLLVINSGVFLFSYYAFGFALLSFMLYLFT